MFGLPQFHHHVSLPTKYLVVFWRHLLSVSGNCAARLGSVVGPVANRTLSFEDNLRSGGLLCYVSQ